MNTFLKLNYYHDPEILETRPVLVRAADIDLVEEIEPGAMVEVQLNNSKTLTVSDPINEILQKLNQQ
ncbi:MAG: hypothetical protein AAF840_03370 [Bacteroidota bacterium]